MRVIVMLLVTAALLIAGCQYESPLTEEHTIAIDASALGLWEIIPEEGEKADPDYQMIILKYSDTEYLVHYPIGNDGLYYRAYPIKIGKSSYIQIEIIGTEDGPYDEDKKEIYHVISYTLENGELEIKSLNTDLVDDDLKDMKALRTAFLKNQDNKDLFTDPGKFRRIKD